MRTLLSGAPIRLNFLVAFCVIQTALGLLVGPTALAGGPADPVPVVRGLPPAEGAQVVALCPDITERPDVFLARAEASLAARLARAGYRVYLVDPWSASEASVSGFDGTVASVYPELVRQLAELGGVDRITWIGPGLCGYLPIAAGARPDDKLPEVDWVAVGARLSWRLPAASLLSWLDSWSKDEVPVPKAAQDLLFTGVRDSVGPRASSVPTLLSDGSERPARVQLETYHRNHLSRPPPAALIADLQRWFSAGTAVSESGWIDYQVGLEKISSRGLVLLGASDPVAPPEAAFSVRDQLPEGATVSFQVLSRVEGMREEYGHLGLLLSHHASSDVDRLILRWMRGGTVGR